MSMEAMKQALEVLEDFVDDPRAQKEIDEASTALRQALAEAEKQEPVAYLYHDARTPMDAHPWLHSTMLVLAAYRRQGLQVETPLYTHPPKERAEGEKREWQGLTDEEWAEIVEIAPNIGDAIRMAQWKLKEKNT